MQRWRRGCAVGSAAWICQPGPLRLHGHACHRWPPAMVGRGQGAWGRAPGSPAPHRVEHDDVDRPNVQRVVQLVRRQRLLVGRADARPERLERAQLLVLLDLRPGRDRASSDGLSSVPSVTLLCGVPLQCRRPTYNPVPLRSLGCNNLCSACACTLPPALERTQACVTRGRRRACSSIIHDRHEADDCAVLAHSALHCAQTAQQGAPGRRAHLVVARQKHVRQRRAVAGVLQKLQHVVPAIPLNIEPLLQP